MKKAVITLICGIIATISCYAAPPKLATEMLFSDPKFRDESTTVYITKTEDNYYRSFKVENNPQLVKIIEEKVNLDAKKAYNMVERYIGKEGYNIILNILNNNETINIGFTRLSDSSAYVFVQGTMNAFR